jgi:hypothetical protein
MRGAVALLLLLLPAVAQDDRRVTDLLKRANAEYEAAKETWQKFVFSASEVTDKELAEICVRYDKAIELCQKASETGDSGEADTMVLRLARRTAQLRATAWAREMRVRAEALKKEKPPEPEAPAPAPEPQKPPEKEPAPAKPPPEKPREPAPEPAAPEFVLPEISETKEQRTRGIQSARDFLMNTYFANRRRDALIDTCTHCKGRGVVNLPYNDPKTQKPWRQDCGGCGATGYHFNEPVARKGFWLCWTPLYRRDEGERTRWAQEVATYKADPRKIPEFLTSVRIEKVDYRGLWAEVQWEEKGATVDGQKFTRDVSRKLIRAGRQWFFFDAERDKDMFSGKPEAD